jgi:hypothetical protein
MKYFYQIALLATFILLAGACAEVNSLRGNPFEKKFPIGQCSRKIDVADPDATLELGKFISPKKGIHLLTPYVRLSFTDELSAEDSVYMSKMVDFLGNRIENQFLQQEWIEGVIPVEIPHENLNESGVPSIIAGMMSNVLEKDTIDYRNWDVPPELILKDITDYSLLFFINGIIGFDEMTENENYFYFFLIDNEAKKVAYSDFLKFRCDVRNLNGLTKVLDYAYLKLLNVRFEQEQLTN